MREIFELINEYPWTSGIVFLAFVTVLALILQVIESIFKK